MARKIPAIFLELNEDGIEQIKVTAKRDPYHQRQASNFYAVIADAILELDEAIRQKRKRLTRQER